MGHICCGEEDKAQYKTSRKTSSVTNGNNKIYSNILSKEISYEKITKEKVTNISNKQPGFDKKTKKKTQRYPIIKLTRKKRELI